MTLTGTPLDPRRKTGARPYSKKRKRPPSVTEIVNQFDKHLDWAASKELSLYVGHHIDDVRADVGRDFDKAVNRLRVHHAGVWGGRAAMGTLVHRINEAWTWGEDADVSEQIERILHEPRAPKIWVGREDEVLAEAMGYLDGLERFWEDWQPVTIATEEVVRDPDPHHGYIGQRDWTCTLADLRNTVPGLWQLDLKSTATQEADKGVYADSWRLQAAAYGLAPELVLYDEAGEETGTAPNYPIDRYGIVHLRGAGHYDLYEIAVDESVLARFRAARECWTWREKECNSPAPRILESAIKGERVA